MVVVGWQQSQVRLEDLDTRLRTVKVAANLVRGAGGMGSPPLHPLDGLGW